ncbi:MAG: hypothetical protein ACE5HU_03050 [Acidobacteriota bacterium]
MFLLLWPLAGFPLGMSTLFGPVMWVTAATRGAAWRQSGENLLVGSIILAYLLGSAALTWWLARAMTRSRRADVRYGIPALLLACTAGAVWLSLTPSMMPARSETIAVGTHFTFGPYPTREKLAVLKREGYTAVISLLHPAVVPFEPRLLSEERQQAERVGLKLIHLPMLPWVSENQAALDRLARLAETGEGRYYVHCYLGRDRVQLARRVVERAAPATSVATLVSSRTLQDGDLFERGKVYRLDEEIFLTPYPTDEEFLAFYLAGSFDHVVSLMDPDDGADRPWIAKERRLLASHGVRFLSLPIRTRPYDALQALVVARSIRALSRPLAVHAFLSASTGKSPPAEAFLQAFRSDLPPLPPGLFSNPLRRGPVEVIAPNIAAGPRPDPDELDGYLRRRGVRRIVYLGNPGDRAARADGTRARERHIDWRAWNGLEDAALKQLGRGGPWYLYGPGLAATKEAIASRFGPAIPPRLTFRPEPHAGIERRPPEAETTHRLAHFLREAAPTPRTLVLLGPVLLLAAVLAGSLVGYLHLRAGVRTPYTRKIFHFIIFTLAAVVQLAAGLSGVMMMGAIVSGAVLYAVARGPGFAFYEAMARPSDAPRRTLFIVVPLVTTALGGLIATLLFGPVAVVGYLVGGWGDAIGEPVGTAWGRHRYKVPSLAGVSATRSLEGSAAVLLVGVTAAFLGLWVDGVPSLTALGVAAACGLAGAVVEAVSHHGLDNLTIQVAAAGVAFLLLV